MTKIKLCGLSREADIRTANELLPDYIGFVFAGKSRRCVTREQAARLKDRLDPRIRAVGVFVNEDPENIAVLLDEGILDLAQLHGNEDAAYVRALRLLTEKPLIQAFKIRSLKDCRSAEESLADYILLDSGAGTGQTFNWQLLKNMQRPYFLAGGLDADNAARAVRQLQPYGVDVSSGIESGGQKDPDKMRRFVRAVRDASFTVHP